MNGVLRLLQPIIRRVRLMIGRAIVRLVDDATTLQTLQVSLLAGEVRSSVERFQQYGFTAHPHPGAEAIAAAVAGNRDHLVVLAVDDRRYRLKSLASGEVAIYDDQGQKVHLKRNGIYIETTQDVVVEAGGKATIKAGGTVEIIGATGAAVKGIVQGDCLCAYTGAPHPMVSGTVKGSQ